MRYSISLFPLDAFADFDEIVRVVRRAEELGFHSVGLAEHIFTPLAEDGSLTIPSRRWTDNFTFGAALARETTALRFNLSALIIPYRHPLLAAQSIGTLDWISGGRLDVTTGVGWLRAEFDALGVPLSERGARTDDYLRAMVELWTNDEPSYDGRFVSFDRIAFGPGCVQRPHVPLLIGGANERAYARVMEFGAGWAPMMAELGTVTAGRARLAELCDAAGHDASALRIVTRVNVLGGSSAIRQAGANVPGTVDSAAGPGRDAAGETIELVGQYAAAGVTELGLSFPWRDASEYVERLEWLAAEVMPHT